MKYPDVQKLHEAGLITAEQRQKIIEQFRLKEESNKFPAIISFVGRLWAAGGIGWLTAAHGEEIPRGVKILVGTALTPHGRVGAGRRREVRQDFRKTGEGRHASSSTCASGWTNR